MKNIFLFGECMIELNHASSNTINQSFAGDVFNAAVYLKRSFDNHKVHLVTAVGKDSYSEDMIEFFQQENIDCDLVFKSDTKIPGLYSIQLDEHGERSFTYWRDNSAAKQVMQHIDEDAIATLSAGDIFFFSGISLAILEKSDLDAFWQLLSTLKAKGVTIAFDLNYRPRLWQSKEEAQELTIKAFAHSTLYLPGVEDMANLFGISSLTDIKEFLDQFSWNEIVLKNGPEEVVYFDKEQQQNVAITPVKKVVDTTSAGDSFNGSYLGARMNGNSPVDAIKLASSVAGFVIQHKGAIVPIDIFNERFSK